MPEPCIVTPQEADGRQRRNGDRLERADLIHTVATEPDRTRVAQRNAWQQGSVHGASHMANLQHANPYRIENATDETEGDRTRAAVVKALRDAANGVIIRRVIRERADAIENGADY